MKHLLIISIILLTTILSTADVNQTPKRKIVIALLDTGLDLNDKSIPICSESKAIVGDSLQDFSSHGSVISEMIKEEINYYDENIDFCILMVKYYTPGMQGQRQIASFIEGLKYISELNTKVDILNISAGGSGFNKLEKQYIDIILKKGIKIVTASCNEKMDLDDKCDAYPACYKTNYNGILVIGAKDYSMGNTGKIVDFYGINRYTTKTGKIIKATSGATAYFSASLARVFGRMK